MKTPAHRYGLFVLLLIGISVIWLYREMCTPEVAASWVQHLGSRGPFMFAGLYGLAPTLHLQGAVPGAVPTMAGEALCGTILGMLLILMGTTIGVMGACLLTSYLVSVWRESRLLETWLRSSSQVSQAE